jgi:drug/metabolite transporter (DMT)-like permease
MLAAALALAAALGWGAADFLGGLRSRRSSLLAVLVVSQSTALVLLVLLVVVSGHGPPDATAIAFAAVAGAGEALAVAALYRGLAAGTMGIVAALAASAPVVPIVVASVTGERPGPWQLTGMVFAVGGVVVSSLVAGSAGDETARRRGRATVAYGLLSAIGFGVFFSAMDRASDASIPWGLLVARLTSVALILVAAAAVLRSGGERVRLRGSLAAAAIGVIIVAADSLYAVASTRGLVTVVAVLAALHPLVTMGFARLVLDERLRRRQELGITLSISGVLVLAAG